MILNLDIDENTAELLNWLADACKLTVSEVADRLMSGHLEELWALRHYLETHGADARKFEAAQNLIVSYGPFEDIMTGLRRIDPTFKSLGEEFEASINESMSRVGQAL